MMDYSIDFVKEEYLGSSSLQYWDSEELTPRPFEALLETGPPPFLSKTYDFVEDPSTDEIVSWSRGNDSFVVWDTEKFATSILPKYFKHNNFASFVRQLNTYGFKKVNPDKWEFANEGFMREQRHLLKTIVRRKTQHLSSQTSNQSLDSCVPVRSFGSDAQIDRLSRCKQVLVTELVKLREEQQTNLSYLKTMEQRLQRAEMKQKQAVSLLAKAIQNPRFLQRISQLKVQKKESDEVRSNKRRRRILNHVSKNVGAEGLVFHGGEKSNFSTLHNVAFPELGQESEENADKNDVGIGQFGNGDFHVEAQQYGEISRFGDLDLEKLALSMQKPRPVMEGKSLEKGECKPIDEGFWEELINETIDEMGTPDVKEGGDDLAEQLGFLVPNLKYKSVDERIWEEIINEEIDEIGTLGTEEGGQI